MAASRRRAAELKAEDKALVIPSELECPPIAHMQEDLGTTAHSKAYRFFPLLKAHASKIHFADWDPPVQEFAQARLCDFLKIHVQLFTFIAF